MLPSYAPSDGNGVVTGWSAASRSLGRSARYERAGKRTLRPARRYSKRLSMTSPPTASMVNAINGYLALLKSQPDDE